MQELIGNLTVEQFTKLLGMLLGCVIFYFCFCFLLTGLAHSIVDGWAFRKGSLYYGSLKYLNQCFKRLKNCGTVESLEVCYAETSGIICLLCYQRTIPKFLYKRLMEKLDFIYKKRKIEICDYWNN